MRTFLVAILLAAAAGAADWPAPLFYCTFDRGPNADFSRGRGDATAVSTDALLYQAERMRRRGQDPNAVDGLVGRARLFRAGRTFPAAGNFNPRRGSILMWVRPTWRGDRTDLYAVFFGCKDWGLLYKYTTQAYVTFGWIKADGYYHYGCTGRCAHWRPGEWHYVAITFDAGGARERRLYLDGRLACKAPILSSRPCAEVFYVGSGVGGVNPARAAIDEFVIFDRVLTDAQIREAYERGRAHRPLFPELVGRRSTAGGVKPPAAAPRPKRPAFVHWELPPGPAARGWRRADRRGGRTATATRERVSLNGFWRFQPEGTTAWGYLRVPGTWSPAGPFRVRGQDGKPVAAIAGQPLSRVVTAWYEREFDLPKGWVGQRIVLGLDSVRAVGEVFLNGRRLGTALEFQRFEADATQAVRPGRNLLQVRVQALSPKSVFRGIDEDVWIERRPRGPNLAWTMLHPLVSAGRIETAARVTEPHDGAVVRVDVTDLAGRPLASGQGRAWPGDVRFQFPARGLEPWRPDRPRLYLARVSLRRGDRVLDELPTIRFGYRRLEVRGSDFYLNGQKFHVRGQAAPPFGRLYFNAVEPNIRAWMKRLRRLHVNAVREYARGWSTGQGCQWRDLYYDVADEVGLIIFAHAPSNRALANAEFTLPPLPELYRARVADFVHRYGDHACVAMWFLNFNHGAHVGDIRPDLLDGGFDPRTIPEKQRMHAWMDFSERILNEADGSRPVFHHAAGNFGQVITVMAYLGFGIPLQEREEWPSAWARTRPKPLMPVETGFPCLLSNYRERRGSLQRVYASEQLTPEYFAAYVGDRAYANLTAEEVRYLNPGASNGTRMAAMKRSINYDEQKALFARWTLRSWRTYDISGYCQHVEWRDGYRYESRRIEPVRRDAREFGPVWPREVNLVRAVGLTRLGRVCQIDNAPHLAYIADPADRFVGKTHAFFAGERVEKSIVLINDGPEAVTFRGRVAVTLAGRPVGAWPIERRVAAGRRVFVPLQFTAPAVDRIERGRIRLQMHADARALADDVFRWECFPRERPPRITAAVALIDPRGRTAAVLKQAGVAYTSEVSSATRLLVIGREALTDAVRAQLRELSVLDRIKAGLNVLVFEQTGSVLAGLPMDDPNARAAFIRAPDHPVLAGLASDDLRRWRGQSDLTEPYPRSPRKRLTWGEEFMRWGNRGVVCSFAPEKPQRGTFRVLVDADFDLYLAPLLEWRLGRGRLMFCQLDVTHRYGIDPAPTRLVNRLLAYMTQPPGAAADTTARVEPGAQRLAKALTVRPAADSRVWLVGPDWRGSAAEVEAFARAGGRVLLVGHQSDRLLQALFRAPGARRSVFKVTVSQGLAARGIVPFNLFLCPT